uniref:Nuclear pore complex protein Nup98-Nup96 n=1 Tax=Nomascus leucogenys TaxID=61853 RepID=A0A2I3GSD8_NOMLE
MFNKSFGTPFGGGTGGFGTTSTFGQNTGFGTTSGGAFGTSAFGSSNNTGGLFGNSQAKPGGLFGTSSFSQPATSTSTGFGFGTSTGTANTLFGTASTGTSLFSSQNNAFAQNKPTGFGNFGTSTSSGGLFGTTNTTSNPFGSTSGSLFGPSSFTAAPTGTTIKFNPPTGTDTMVKAGVSTNISTKHQCITAMKEYESKSLEELRLEDYQANRKGPQNQVGAGTTTGLFGSSPATSSATGLFSSSTTNSGFAYGQNKTAFGTSTTGFGTNPGGLFGQQNQQTTSLFSKPFGQATTTQNTGFSFGNTSTIGQPSTNTMGLFGVTQASQPGGLFGTATNTSTGTAFGTGTGLFGQTNTGFGAVGSTLFGNNKLTTFGSSTTSAPSFGTTSGGLFEALCLFKAGHWNRCHKLIIRHLASDAIINENYDYLKGFLEDLAPPERSSLIQDWETSGLVYLDYIRVIEMLHHIQQVDCSGYDLEQLHIKVTSLCSRIEQIQCYSAKDRLAQSDMAKRVANLLRVVLSLHHAPDRTSDSTPDPQRVPLRLLAPHIGRLPMPEDYAMDELRSLTQSYLRELAVGSL